MSLNILIIINLALIISGNDSNDEDQKFNELNNKTDEAVLDLNDQYLKLKELTNSIHNYFSNFN